MLRYYLGGLLALMALGQAVSWDAYSAALDTYGIGPLGTTTAVTLFAGEVMVAAGLVLGLRPRATAIGAVIVTALWSALAVQAFARGLFVPNCGCFGRFLSQELRWWVLLEDVAFVGYALLHLRRVLASPHEPQGAEVRGGVAGRAAR